MATRKTTFEVVPLADIAPLLKDAQETGFAAAPRAARILSVTYDLSLATTREMLFSSAGFQVTSVLTVGQAIERCAAEEFELVIVGHSIPLDQRKWLLKEVRGRCATPVLALRRAGEPPLTEADYTFDSTESPALLLETVVNILRPRNHSAITGRRNGVIGPHDAKEAQRHQ
jgi:DNA-binding NtrC family response regulator